jgi:hypothetical protein
MSSLAYIDITYHSNREIFVLEILELYLANGWNLNDNGHISLRPLGDKDDFDWIQLQLDQIAEVKEIIRNKVTADEDPAVVLVMNHEEVGAATTFYPKDRRINFLLDIGKKTHPELPHWTDVSWYLPPIFRPLLVGGLIVSQVKFTEIS